VRQGVRKLRLTGGEPLLRRGLPELVARLAAIPGVEDLALTTNGSLLAGKARALREAGLHRLTVSLDALDRRVFRALSGNRGEVADVLAGIAAAEAAGFALAQDQLRAAARRQRIRTAAARASASAARRTCCASSSTWTWAAAMAGRRRRAAAREARDRIAARWPLRPLSPRIAARWRRATPSPTAPARSASSAR
jgi:cyclic pyranopterin phosphate synthase